MIARQNDEAAGRRGHHADPGACADHGRDDGDVARSLVGREIHRWASALRDHKWYPERFDIFAGPIEEGFARAGGNKTLATFDVAPIVMVMLGDDLQACRTPVKAMLALYVGRMGARDKNFYRDYVAELGYGSQAQTIQDLYLAGRKDEAAAAVPDQLVDEVALVGSRDRIRDRAQRWIEAGKKRHVSSMLLGTFQIESLELMAELML